MSRRPNLAPRIAQFLSALVVLTALVATPAPASAQGAHPSAVAPDSLRRIQSVEPRNGPVGTMVAVYTENLPMQARVHVGVGRTGFGWEALAEGAQGELGEVSATVRVPDFATWDRPLVFIIFNGIFSPIGISEPFHVTNSDGLLRRVGRITDEGVECLAMRDQDDFLYTLTGEVGGLEPGDEVVVEATYQEMSMCQQGSTIQVVRVVDIGPNRDGWR